MKTLEALKFLFIGPAILAMLAVINWLTTPGVWWVQWPALGIGIAWLVSLSRVARAVLLAGGITALLAMLAAAKSKKSNEPVSIL